MALFNFITNEGFRKSLESDFIELENCIQAESWKAVHVIAGSIIEAVLLDFLLAEGICSEDEALKMDFGTAITICDEKKIISSKTINLSSVIKDYRNLIHPGRILRLKEETSKESAEVARALVIIVTNEIEKKKSEKYGYTAEQIISKIWRDSSVSSILPHLLKATNPTEIAKLLLKVLPQTYSEYLESNEYVEHIPISLSQCFRIALGQSDDALKTRVAENFAKVIKEEGIFTINANGHIFFRASDMCYLGPDDLDLVKKYMLGRIEDSFEEWYSTFSGIGRFIQADEVQNLADSLIKIIVGQDKDVGKKAQHLLEQEGQRMMNEAKEKLLARLDDWISHFQKKTAIQNADKLVKLKSQIFKDDLPF